MNGSRDYQEKRGFRRMALEECPATYRIASSGEQGAGVVRDLSGGGMRLHCDRPLAPGTRLLVTVAPERSTIPPLEAEAEVVRISEVPGGYEIGLTVITFSPRSRSS